jgi:predicted amidohydrolase YtcJ
MPAADLVFKNARVITMDAAQPVAELVAIKGSRIMLVADNEALYPVMGASTKVIDCGGRTLVPGFNDAHCHLFSLVRKLLSIDLSPPRVGSIVDIKKAIGQRVRSLPYGSWVTAADYNEFYLAEKRHPNRWEIDEIAPNHPVVLTHRSLHACVLNSLALRLAGITGETLEPPGGIIDRDLETGEPSGILFEMLGYIRERVLPPLSEEELARGIALANRYYLSYGVTSLQDASITNDLNRWRTLRRWQNAGSLKSRVLMMFGIDALSRFQEAGLEPGSGDERLRLGGVKVMVGEATGRLQPPQVELNRQAFTAHSAGFQLAIHAIEQGTVEAAIAALEHVRRQQKSAGRRHRIEHCAECPPELLERLKRLQAFIVTQPPFLYYSGERYLATVPARQLPWLYRFRSFLDSGLTVAGSSDCPVAPASPLVGMYAAVTRRAENGQEVLPEQSVSADQALAMYTINAARTSFEDDIKGSITVGKLADMVVLSANPTRVPPEEIKDIRVEMTIVDGKMVWGGAAG